MKQSFNLLERKGLISLNPNISIARQCELLSIKRSTYYYNPKEPSEKEIRIKHRIDEIFTEFPYYGYRKIYHQLKLENFDIGIDLTHTYMKEMGIRAIYPQKNLSKSNPENKKYPYLLRGLEILKPNHVWGIDITYIRLYRGWLYLVIIIDWYSRYIVRWELDQTLEISFVLEAVEKALSINKPVIMNSDQGSHFTSNQYCCILNREGIKISMDGKRRALDNIFTERFFRSLKYEEVYLNDYQNPREARLGIANYIEKYNNKRLHQSLGYKTPAEFYLI